MTSNLGDYYYYDDEDYYDYYDAQAIEPSESPLQAAYAQAKGMLLSNPAQCIVVLQQLLEMDTDRGRWTFKALKNLARASYHAGQYDEMLAYYQRIAEFEHDSIDAAARQKAMAKCMDQCVRVPPGYTEELVRITLRVTEKDTVAFSKLWFNTVVRQVNHLLATEKYDEALGVMQHALKRCGEGSEMTHNSDIQRYTIYFLQLRAYEATKQYARLRSTYFEAARVNSTLLPLHQVAAVLECGGHMFLRGGDWFGASKAFFSAFSAFSECGDAQSARCLKFMVLSHMLADTAIDSFASNQAKTRINTPEVKPIVLLLQAFLSYDLNTFQSILQGPDTHACLLEDERVAPLIEPLLFRMRVRVLVHHLSSFSRVSVAYLSQKLNLSERETEEICTFAMLQDLFVGRLDDLTGALHIFDVQPSNEVKQAEALRLWSEALLD